MLQDFARNRLKSDRRARRVRSIYFVAVLSVISPQAWGQSSVIVYPSQGQSMQQQAKDESECKIWAQQQTGFSPASGPSYSAPPTSAGGQVVGGAARGAALGAVGGAIGGDAGKGAAIGAGVGATAGLLRRGQQQRANHQAQQQAVNQYNQQLANYQRAFGACMQGRHYVVN
jgi:hypothetical protein